MSKKEPLEVIEQIELTKLHPFPDHPFGVRDDDSMQQTVESIREYGVLVPAIARPREDGGYELIAGHRRKHACELAGLKTMPVIVRDMSQLTGKTEEELASDLRGVIYMDFNRKPDGSYTWRTADDFLSGNVREKLA